jgi:retron-type reverse transcriptase
MNDFTKEELILLWRSLYHMIEIGYFIQPSTHGLLAKIQSLIDNYCEHEWIIHLNARGCNVTCQKCSKDLI